MAQIDSLIYRSPYQPSSSQIESQVYSSRKEDAARHQIAAPNPHFEESAWHKNEVPVERERPADPVNVTVRLFSEITGNQANHQQTLPQEPSTHLPPQTMKPSAAPKPILPAVNNNS